LGHIQKTFRYVSGPRIELFSFFFLLDTSGGVYRKKLDMNPAYAVSLRIWIKLYG